MPKGMGRLSQNRHFFLNPFLVIHTAPNRGKESVMPKTASRPHTVRKEPDPPDWKQILLGAVNKPGVISTAYRAFWNYSFGNQLLAMFECHSRGIEPGPIHTFKGWLALNRHVKKGERGITLCMPVTWVKKPDPREAAKPDDPVISSTTPVVRRRFLYRPNWFVLSQTDGEPYTPLEIPQWEERRACHVLFIDHIPFTLTNGNVQGYARDREFAVSPVAHLPHRTAFHEIAHIELGHCAESMGMTDGDDRTPRDVREVEAEAVSFICCQSLGLPGEEFSRGYLQHWLGNQKIEERSVHRILTAADRILKAGRPGSQVDLESETDPTDSIG
jgi:antirestriction protein ArdC